MALPGSHPATGESPAVQPPNTINRRLTKRAPTSVKSPVFPTDKADITPKRTYAPTSARSHASGSPDGRSGKVSGIPQLSPEFFRAAAG